VSRFLADRAHVEVPDAFGFAIGGAAPMPPQLLRWYAHLGLEIGNVYGSGERRPVALDPAEIGGVRHCRLAFDGVQSCIDPGRARSSNEAVA
jgi:long-chain acyl-CoA synthetase